MICPTPKADVTIEKLASLATATKGQQITFTLKVTNNGPDAAQNVTVSDPVTANLENPVVISGPCTITNGNLNCSFGTMNAGATAQAQIVYTVGQSAVCGGNVINIATVSTTTEETNTANNQDDVTVGIICPTGCIEVLKEAFDPFGNKLSVVPQFVFKLDGGVQTMVNDSTGRLTFNNVTPGSHTVTEVIPAGWSQFLVTPANGIVNVVSGTACAGVTFKNQQNPVSSSSSSSSSTPTADVQIIKNGPTSINRGDTISYTLIVKNNGPSTAQTVTVTDAVPTGLTYIDAQSDSRCDVVDNIVVCQLGNMTNQQQTSIGLVFQTSQQTACGTLSNTAVVSTITAETNSANNLSSIQTNVICPSSSSSSSSSVGTGCIEILKEAFDPFGNKLSVVPQFQFQLDGNQTATNDSTGRVTFTGVSAGTHTITETMQQGWNQFLVTPVNGTVTVFPGNLCAGVIFKNQQNALSSSSSSSSTSSSSSSSSSTGNPDLTIQKSGPTTVFQSTEMTYTLTVQNNNATPALNVTVTDALPAGTTYVTSTGATCANTNGVVTCQLGTVNLGSPRTITITVLVQSTVACGGNLVNSATVATTSTESNTSNNVSNQVTTQVQCQTLYGCIEVTKEAYDINNNQIFTVPSFTFVLDGNRTTVNASNGKARFDSVTVGNHTVIETVPSGWSLTNVTPSNGTVNVVAGTTCAQILFRNKQSTGTTNDFTISKTDGESEVEAGDSLTYRITVRNNSNITVNNVTVTDTLPDEVDFQDCDKSCSHSGRFITWSNQTFAAGEQKVYEVEVDVDDDADGELLNTAQVFDKTATDRTDVEDDDDDDNDEDFDAELTKVSSVSEVFPGGIVEYTVRFENTGDDDLQDVVITDTLPAEVIVIDDGDADSHSGNKLEWEIGDVDSGDDWIVRYRVSVSSSAFPGQILRNEVCAEDDDEEIDECESVTVAVIGNLPQTGVMGDGLTASSVKLKSIRMGGSESSSDPLAPLAAWISIVGVGVGIGMGAGRRLLIGF